MHGITVCDSSCPSPCAYTSREAVHKGRLTAAMYASFLSMSCRGVGNEGITIERTRIKGNNPPELE